MTFIIKQDIKIYKNKWYDKAVKTNFGSQKKNNLGLKCREGILEEETSFQDPKTINQSEKRLYGTFKDVRHPEYW